MVVAATHASGLAAAPELAVAAGFTYEALAHRVFGDGTHERVGDEADRLGIRRGVDRPRLSWRRADAMRSDFHRETSKCRISTITP